MTTHLLAEGAGTSGTGLITQIAVLVTAILSGIAALRLRKRDTDAEEMASLRATCKQQGERLTDLQADVLSMRTWAYTQRAGLADKGITLPDPPPLRSESWT